MPSHKAPPSIPFRERLSCTLDEAAEATGLCRQTLYRRIDAGELDTFTIGRRRLIRLPSLLALIDGCPQEIPR